MKNKPLQSETGTSNWILIVLTAAFLVFIGYKVGVEPLQKQSANWLLLTLAAIMILGAVLTLLTPRIYGHVLIYDDYIEFSQFGGLRRRKVLRKELLSYELLTKKGRYVGYWKELTLFVQDDHYTINSQHYANFEVLQRALIVGLPETDRLNRRARH